MSISSLAPVVLFVYNRPEHLQATVESLRANDLASSSDLFVFSDAARSEAAAAKVESVRKYIRGIAGFKSVVINEREQNFGLARSVITGVSEILDRFGQAIVMEDDLLTTSDFLLFMNSALRRYAEDVRVFSVSGFNHAAAAPTDYPYDGFFAYRSSSWGWATWRDRWIKADWSVSDYDSFNSDRRLQKLFNRGGEDLAEMLNMQMAGRLDSWAIRWAYAHFTQNAVALLPVVSKVLNTGLDGSGTHCRTPGFNQQSLRLNDRNATYYRYPDSPTPTPHFTAQIQRVYKRSLIRKIGRVAHRAFASSLPLGSSSANRRSSVRRESSEIMR